jgi:hypothetical protein
VSSKTMWLGSGCDPLAAVQMRLERCRGNGQWARGMVGAGPDKEWPSRLEKGHMARRTGAANGCTWWSIVRSGGRRESRWPSAAIGAEDGTAQPVGEKGCVGLTGGSAQRGSRLTGDVCQVGGLAGRLCGSGPLDRKDFRKKLQYIFH